MTISPIIPNKQVSLTWSEFVDQYKPIKNSFSKDPDQVMFETYGEEVEFVTKADNKHIWTYLDTDGGSVTTEGYHYVNRIGYYITEVPWEDNTDYEVDLEMYLPHCDDCGREETLDGEIVMEVFACDQMHEYCLNCCGCEDHKGEKWYE